MITKERAGEIERRVFYRFLDNIAGEFEKCTDHDVIFHVGRQIGMMQAALQEELERECDKEEN